MDYAVNRHFSSAQGRFMQVDPIGMASVSLGNPQTLNLYAYTANDPVNNVDPLGLSFCERKVTEYGPGDWTVTYTCSGGGGAVIPQRREQEKRGSGGVGTEKEEKEEEKKVKTCPILKNPGYAILGTAGLTALADSPAPGPADLIALGILGYALYKIITFEPAPVLSVTDKIGKIASDLGWTEKAVRDAIHKVKQNIRGSGVRKNPDVLVDTEDGEVYPKNPDGSCGDSIGNIHDP